MPRIYDISMTIEEGMQVWKGYDHKKPKITNVQNHDQGKPHESRLDMDVHCGTHVDAPLHMLAGGETIETISLDQLVGPARVLDLTHVKDAITKEDLVPFHIQRGERILFKTSSSYSEEFLLDFVYLREDGAKYLADIGIAIAATDALGIERAQSEYPTHRTLMRAGVIIVEGLRLKHVEPGNYYLVIAPLKLTGIDAAPARAMLIGD
ncbi:cyclase family protein [Cohnella nanjingensis]|uniref:Kynurenine formamidase n=1 Tax=Cohnella nanjingensis TaxID=1387779 RepID=A0A7X0VJQ6_9BACL|nr:cyclase family protein [Cohnella nanjingensis]MBB6674979.1 cyclase family protein [Cohnella nanjingensis]